MDTRSLAHFIWIGEGGLPRFYQDCLTSFSNKHRGWKIKLWTEKDTRKIIANSKFDFNKYPSFINRYNFIKYHILAQEGGWFIDLDIVWKKSIDQIYTDKIKTNTFPDLFIPVRRFPRQKEIDLKMNDDMLMYAKKGVFKELLEYINLREDIDLSKPYEPYGPVSLSSWVYRSSYSRVYLFEEEIQENGYYCEHKNKQSWKFS